jgi:hypothetical protein
MGLPTRIQDIVVSFADASALQTWVAGLAADIGAGKITGFELSTGKREGKITGTITIPTPGDLTVVLEDPPE